MARTILVTGCSSGLGAAVCAALVDAGARVLGGVRSGAAPKGVEPLTFDVRDEGSVTRALGGLAALDGLVNCAGLSSLGPLEWTSTADFRALLEVNVLGVHTVTRAVMPALRASRGRLVNVSSMSGLIAPPFAGAYAASKFALEAMSDAWRMELKPFGVHVAVVEPGALATPMWARLLEELKTTTGAPAYPEWSKAREALERIGAQAAQPFGAVEKVLHALTSDAPRTRYPEDDRASVDEVRTMSDEDRDALLRSGWGLRS